MGQLKVIAYFYKFLLFFELFGHIRFNYQSSTYKYFKLRQLFSTLYLVIHLNYTLYRQYYVSILLIKTNSSTGDVNSKIFDFVSRIGSQLDLVTVFMSHYKTIVSSKQQHQILRNIEVIDEYLMCFGKVSVNLWISFELLLQLVIFVPVFSIPYFIMGLPLSFQSIFNYLVGALLIKSGIMKYCFYVNLVKSRLQSTKDILKELVAFAGTHITETTNKFDRSVYINNVLNIKRIHSLISDNVQLINESLGLTIMFQFFVVFTLMTVNLYQIFMQLNDKFTIGILGKLNYIF